jgi:hypothetical protein
VTAVSLTSISPGTAELESPVADFVVIDPADHQTDDKSDIQTNPNQRTDTAYSSVGATASHPTFQPIVSQELQAAPASGRVGASFSFGKSSGESGANPENSLIYRYRNGKKTFLGRRFVD